MTDSVQHAEVAIIGAGPAGLTAARELRRSGVRRVVVLEREEQPGGIPRHSDHFGYGRRDLHRFMTGPVYARLLAARAVDSGADVRVQSMVTDWADERSLMVTSPQGRYRLDADSVVLATGARERSRPARMVPGDRPAGVYTTGQLQNLVHLQGQSLDGPAVVVGAELVSWSAALTLRHAGVRRIVMLTSHPRPEIHRPVALAGRSLLGIELRTSATVGRIVGREVLEAVDIVDVVNGTRRLEPCRTVVFTGDWVPDHELATLAGLDSDPAHGGPLVDTGLRTSAEGVFAAGNIVHPVDTADVAALDGRHVAMVVAQYLAGRDRRRPAVRLTVDPPLRWVAPGLFRPGDGAPSRGRLLVWAESFAMNAVIEARQADRVIGTARLLAPMSPGRMVRVPWRVVRRAKQESGPVTLRVY